mgnify:CR=1 FL=1
MTHKDPLRPKNNLYLHFERGDSHHGNIPINKPLKLATDLLRSLLQNNFERMISRSIVIITRRQF